VDYGDAYDGTWAQYVIIGERRQHSGEEGRWQVTPFITGYRKQVGGQLSPSLIRTDRRTGRTSRLGNDFKLFRIWQPGSPVAMKDWINMLAGWGEFLRLFVSWHINPPRHEEASEALRDVATFANCEPLENCLQPVLHQFPMHRHSCDFPTVCPYQQMDCCYGDIPFNDPTRGGIYRLKENHEHSSSID
jgi:hypothetical protein